jgi:tetratricopeptide (TPR) repeat protein
MSSATQSPSRTHRIGWQESSKISAARLAKYIQLLQAACQRDPCSADLRTCLGIAQARNFDVRKSMESFETAIGLDSKHFFARFKYAELLFGVGLLERAAEETNKALELASSNWEFSMARRQLQAIRHRVRQDTQ